MESNKEISQEKIDELLEFLPLFENTEQEFLTWVSSEETESGIMSLSYPVYKKEVIDFFEKIWDDDWIDFGYNPDEVAAQMNELFIRQANISQIKSLFTFAQRGERFCDGFWGELLSNGKIVMILKRLKEIRNL